MPYSTLNLSTMQKAASKIKCPGLKLNHLSSQQEILQLCSCTPRSCSGHMKLWGSQRQIYNCFPTPWYHSQLFCVSELQLTLGKSHKLANPINSRIQNYKLSASLFVSLNIQQDLFCYYTLMGKGIRLNLSSTSDSENTLTESSCSKMKKTPIWPFR